ncbi:MAG: hypothetical protein MUF36_00665 [Bacteroidales bacterium]|jgi:hypothetical protein|nr:hypothetical protein [Bacteroidales bacterium]
MHIKKTIIALLLTVITFTVSAQKRERKEVMLNDGTVIKGTIVADSSDFLKVKIKRPQIITLNKALVYSTGSIRQSASGSAEKRGYSIRLSASLLAGRNISGNTGSMSIHLSNGYQFRNGFGAGFGTGIEKPEVLIMPVYGEIRYQPLKTRLSPFLWMKSGYGFPLNRRADIDYYYYGYSTESKGGVMFNAGAGLALYSWNRNAVSIGIGYRYQKLIFAQKNIWRQEAQNELITYFNRFEVQFGFIFR